MNFRHLFIIATMTCAANMYASAPVMLELDALPANSGFTQDWNEAEKCWKLNVVTNDFGNIRPSIQFKPLTADLDPELDILAFEYRSTRAVGTQLFTMYNAGRNGTSTRTADLAVGMEAVSEWTTVRFDVSDLRTSRFICLGKKDQYQALQFNDLVTGAEMQIRNIRYEADEQPYTPLTIAREGITLVEAENFNASTKGAGHNSRQYDKSRLTRYINPVPGEIPIYAFTSADYQVIQKKQTNPATGQEETINDWEASAKLLQKKYKDMEEAGFNITEGTAWPGVDLAALYPDRDVNGAKIDLFEGLKLKMMVRNGLTDAHLNAVKSSPRLAGYVVKDEPYAHEFPEMRSNLERIRAIDNSRLLYGNLIQNNYSPTFFGTQSYDDYVERYIKETGMGFLSFDYYGIHQLSDDPDDVVLMPNYFQNLEIIAKFAKAYNTVFWSFTRSMSSLTRPGHDFVVNPVSFRYPEPTEEYMRVLAFANFLYGAQGLEYWPYTSCEGCEDAPIKSDGTLNPAWHYAKSINADVKALTWVFLGAEMLRVGHTNFQTPMGCVRLTQAMLPDGVTSVTTDGEGMPVSVLQNGTNLFLMALNADIKNNQNITVVTSRQMKQVRMDGSLADLAAGSHTHALKPGQFILYQVASDMPESRLNSVATANSGYRKDTDDVIVGADPAASNGYYLADMGPESWNIYSGITPEDEKREISEEDALANWGASFRYTIDVPEDITVSISVGHSVPWNEYGRVAAIGAEPGLSYTIAGKPSLNWPKQYAASMRLAVDGETVVPANQPLRPAVPATFTDDGAEFSRILADKSQWISTANADGSPSDVLYFWPAQGGDNSLNVRYNETPDYQGVRLSAGKHVITVTSLSYPWHFDNLKIETTSNSGIESIMADDDMPVEWYNLQGIRINPETAAPGLYIRRQGNKSQKVAL